MCEIELTRLNYHELLVNQVNYRSSRNERFVRNRNTKVKFSKPLGCSGTLGLLVYDSGHWNEPRRPGFRNPGVNLHPGKGLPSV